MQKTYFIVKQGIYAHGCYGPFASEEIAIAAFNKKLEEHHAKNKEREELPFADNFDGHHDYYLLDHLPQIGEDFDTNKGKIIPHSPVACR